MSATTVFFRFLFLAGASVKRKISELKGALAKASYMRKVITRTVKLNLHFIKFLTGDFEVVKEPYHST